MKEIWAAESERIVRVLLLLLLAAVIAVSGDFVLGDGAKKRQSQKDYERLAAEVKTEAGRAKQAKEEPEGVFVSPIDFDRLAEINPDVVGWIQIPGTHVDYPIVQAQDNEKYQRKSFDGKETAAGSIFLDFESQSDMRGYNHILYGHNMKNGSMFQDIVRYKEEDYFKEHQYFEIYTPYETIHLKAAACYDIPNHPMVRTMRFQSGRDFQEFVETMLRPCRYAEIPKEPVKSLYVLATCSYEADDARTVLFAVEVR